MQDSKTEPVYLIYPNDAMIAEYGDLIMDSLCNDTPPLTITVQPETVKKMDATEVHNLMLTLQHYPQYIEEMLFTIGFKFPSIAGGGLYMTEQEWKSSREIIQWFRNAGTLPLTLFFVHDADARFHMLAGDFIAENLFPVVAKDDKRGKVKVAVQGAMADALCERLAGSCYMMLLFCHGSGFDPRPVIESVIADFGLPVNYDIIHEQYIADINDPDLMNQRIANVMQDYFEQKKI